MNANAQREFLERCNALWAALRQLEPPPAFLAKTTQSRLGCFGWSSGL
ncbi:MAG: hypothetical protein ACK41E_03385 [Deinococcales bacterium]